MLALEICIGIMLVWFALPLHSYKVRGSILPSVFCGFSVWSLPALPAGFHQGLQFPHTVQRHTVWLISGFKLPVGVNLSMNGCLFRV